MGVIAVPTWPRAVTVGVVDDARWDAYVDAHPERTAYHYAGWPRLLARAFDHETVLLAATRGRAVIGVLPLVAMRSRLFGRFVVSLPYLNEAGLLADDPAVERALVDAAINVAQVRGADYVELRNRRRRDSRLTERRHKVGMSLVLRSTVEEQWQALDRKLRNQVRKAEKNGVSVTVGGAELVPDFYGVFARNMRDLGTPVFGVRLFDEALATFPDRTRVFCARHGADGPVAASIAHWRGGSIEVIWASALRESNEVSANVLLYWHMLKFAIERQCALFEFGRCTPGEGPFRFKQQWGAEPRPLVWEYWTARPSVDLDKTPRNPKYRAAVALWRHLPVGVATWLGPRIVRAIPC